MAYIGLHNHTDKSNFRLKDSIAKLPELIEYAHSLGHKGIAITEHETVNPSLSAIEFYFDHKDLKGWEDFKIICGNEIYLCPDYTRADNDDPSQPNVYPHFILLAMNEKGHEQIRKLSTKAWSQSFRSKNMMRVPTYYNDLIEVICSEERGNVVASTACLGGEIAKTLLKMKDTGFNEILWQNCIQWINWMKNDIFGDGYFFLELQPSHNDEQVYVNEKLIELSKITNTPYIITTDAHYVKKDDKLAHSIYLKSQDGDREVDAFYETTYVMSEEEIHEYMDEYLGYDVVQKGIDNTMLIYNMAEMFDLRRPLHIPYIPQNIEEPNEILYKIFSESAPLLGKFYNSSTDSDRHLCREILNFLDSHEDYRKENYYNAINTCLDSIYVSSEKMNTHWSAYLLQIADYVKVAWQCDTLVGAGRGSGVGFWLLYMLGITQIDPERETTATFHWRFLNPERASVLDIDIDIESNARDRVINGFKQRYGDDRVSKVLTIQTEKPRSAILTAARGLGLETDIAQYLASLIVSDRGVDRSLHTMYYGNSNEGIKPVYEFKNEMDKYPELWDMAQKFEGIVKGIGSHAGGVVVVDEPFTATTALMKTNSGDIVTQSDLHELEKMSLIKVDLLAIDALDKIHSCLNLLLEYDVIKWQGSLKDTYDKYIGVYNLERNNKEMWKMLWEHKVISFFQMEKESGYQGIALTHPESVDDLATLNSVIRLMAQEEGAETPLQKYARFKQDISLWYEEMSNAGLTLDEQEVLKEILGVSYGICEAQEFLFLLVMHPRIGGFSLAWADQLRKSVAKKKPEEFKKLEKEFFENRDKKGLSKNLTDYVWNTLVSTQRGYGFNKSHTLSYSIIGLQELNLAYRFPEIYWNTANLIVDSGSLSENSEETTDYGKISTAIAKIKNSGIDIELPLINEANYSFVPDAVNNRIIYSLKAINGIGNDTVDAIINNRPYSSFENFIEKTQLTKVPMLSLIKAGAFTELDNVDTTKTMEKYIRTQLLKMCKKLTFSQFNTLEQICDIPDDLYQFIRIKRYKEYVLDDEGFYEYYIDKNKKIPKSGYHDRFYILDNNSMPFFQTCFSDESIVKVHNQYYVISEKKFLKEYQKKIQPLVDWMQQDTTLEMYNTALYNSMYNKLARGSKAHWEMEALGFYYGQHELADVDLKKYGVVNYFDLPEEPEVYDTYKRYVKGQPQYFPKYKIDRIAGTVINKDNQHSMITLLTTHGVVNVKFNKGKYAFYNRRIKSTNGEVDESRFKRGTILMICGYRRESQFVAYRYNDTVYQHSLVKISQINKDKTFELIVGRMEES